MGPPPGYGGSGKSESLHRISKAKLFVLESAAPTSATPLEQQVRPSVPSRKTELSSRAQAKNDPVEMIQADELRRASRNTLITGALAPRQVEGRLDGQREDGGGSEGRTWLRAKHNQVRPPKSSTLCAGFRTMPIAHLAREKVLSLSQILCHGIINF